MEDTTFWIAVLAVAVAIQSLVWIGIGIAGFMAYRQVTKTLEAVQRDAVAPLVAHAHTALEKVEDATARIQSADDKVRDFLNESGQKASRVAASARSALWPLMGIGRSAMAAIQAFNHPTRPRLAHAKPGDLAVARQARRVP